MDIKLSLAGRTCCLEAITTDSQTMCAPQLPLTPQYKWPTEIRPKEKPKQFLLNMPVLLTSWILTVPNSQRLVSQLVLSPFWTAKGSGIAVPVLCNHLGSAFCHDRVFSRMVIAYEDETGIHDEIILLYPSSRQATKLEAEPDLRII
jgi:hypothetical protein